MTNREQDWEICLMRRALARIEKGTKGLDARVGELENNKKAKPAKALALLMAQIAVVVAVLKGLDMLARALGWW